jgi:bifunctional DNase/RNase
MAAGTLPRVVPMELVGVRLELPANAPIVLLREQDGQRRQVPIYIGGPEAAAIHYALEGIEPPRPLTHDLLKNVLDELQVVLDRVVVTEVRDRTYYAELHLVVAGSAKKISSRPSDAIALAVRTGSPIFAEEALLDEVGQVIDEEADAEAAVESEDLLEEFRDFIENVNPEDFAGGEKGQ